MEKPGTARTGVVPVAIASNVLNHRSFRCRFGNCRSVCRRSRNCRHAEKADCSGREQRQQNKAHLLFLPCQATKPSRLNRDPLANTRAKNQQAHLPEVTRPLVRGQLPLVAVINQGIAPMYGAQAQNSFCDDAPTDSVRTSCRITTL